LVKIVESLEEPDSKHEIAVEVAGYRSGPPSSCVGHVLYLLFGASSIRLCTRGLDIAGISWV
jgi:hypothetical protein